MASEDIQTMLINTVFIISELDFHKNNQDIIQNVTLSVSRKNVKGVWSNMRVNHDTIFIFG